LNAPARPLASQRLGERERREMILPRARARWREIHRAEEAHLARIPRQ
jgi:hypothetical protein